jgi:pimeloyl-ACP methyl ester carboxylesterase
MRRFTPTIVAAGLATVVFTAITLAAPPQAHAQTDNCRDVSVPVTMVGQQLNMHGILCHPAGAAKPAVQVLVPGATYNQTYWNFPYRPDTYNFRLAMNRAGFTTLTLDRLGTGASSRPPSATLSANAQANAVHQVIQALRQGKVTDKPVSTVILGGHSVGSMTAMWEASTYHDVNAVLLTGISHNLNSANVAKVVASTVRPAALDPQIGNRGYDPGYLTTIPGTRADDFYAPGVADPAVARTDEETKDVFAGTEAPDAIAASLTPATRAIDVPVLLANGAQDVLMCGAGTDCASAATLKATEDPFFSPAAHLHTFSLPGFGHDINLAPNTGDYQRAVIDWANSVADGPSSGGAHS